MGAVVVVVVFQVALYSFFSPPKAKAVADHHRLAQSFQAPFVWCKNFTISVGSIYKLLLKVNIFRFCLRGASLPICRRCGAHTVHALMVPCRLHSRDSTISCPVTRRETARSRRRSMFLYVYIYMLLTVYVACKWVSQQKRIYAAHSQTKVYTMGLGNCGETIALPIFRATPTCLAGLCVLHRASALFCRHADVERQKVGGIWVVF